MVWVPFTMWTRMGDYRWRGARARGKRMPRRSVFPDERAGVPEQFRAPRPEDVHALLRYQACAQLDIAAQGHGIEVGPAIDARWSPNTSSISMLYIYTIAPQLTSIITLPSCALTSSLSTSCVSSTSPHCSV